jgi:hypothetical protein
MELDDFVVKAGKTFITIRTSDWRGDSTHKFTTDDVARYYATDARNISSGIRTLGTLNGDWRPVDELATYCLEYFKAVNAVGMRNAGKRFGLTAKF